ncbi:hypothetical protein EVAR_31896_1 [Eumeta japonica]|uniref:Uncharacterized protein n=1 Tax=Eumeta variegata TaxID=151549 RepID=A0A4C1WV14_EUMVA|nr:hypothetical protein EVAR_31896_1 [Eumeta japonica]
MALLPNESRTAKLQKDCKISPDCVISDAVTAYGENDKSRSHQSDGYFILVLCKKTFLIMRVRAAGASRIQFGFSLSPLSSARCPLECLSRIAPGEAESRTTGSTIMKQWWESGAVNGYCHRRGGEDRDQQLNVFLEARNEWFNLV